MTQKPLRRWAHRTAALAASAVLAIATAVVTTAPANAAVDVYSAPGNYYVNGRDWRTTCEPYSQTQRCRTDIWSTQVTQVGKKFVQKTGWYFNNLTYISSPRSLWTNNPLGGYGVHGGTANWTAAGGRHWRTECDTATSGGNGCRSYVTARVVEAYRTSSGATAYRWVTKEVFNNIVRFGTLPIFKDVAIGTTVSLKYFDVTVSNPRWDGNGVEAGALVKICYTHTHPDAGADGKVRVSRDPWQFGVRDGEAEATELHYYYDSAVFPTSTRWNPVYGETTLALGACQTGYLAIDYSNPHQSLQFNMRYAPAGSSDRITWHIYY